MKKKLYSAVVCLSIACITNAQVKKGDVLLGGGVGFNKGSSSATDNTGISVYPSIGKAIEDNLVLGVNLSYLHGKTVQGYYTYKSDSYGAGFFIRKYRPLGSGFALFMEGSLAYSYWKQYQSEPAGNATTSTKTSTITAGFSPGITYAISKHVLLETAFQNMAYMNYNHVNTETFDISAPQSVSKDHSNAFAFSTNLSQALNSFIVGVKFVI